MSARPDVFLPEANETHFLTKVRTRGLRWYEKTHFATPPRARSSVRSRRPTSAARRAAAGRRVAARRPGDRAPARSRPARPGSHVWTAASDVGLRRRARRRAPSADGRPVDFDIPHEIYVEEGIYGAPSPGMGAGGRPRGAPRAATEELSADPEATYRALPSHPHRPRTRPGVVASASTRPSRCATPGSLRFMLHTHAWERLPGKLARGSTPGTEWNGVPPMPADLRRSSWRLRARHLDALGRAGSGGDAGIGRRTD